MDIVNLISENQPNESRDAGQNTNNNTDNTVNNINISSGDAVRNFDSGIVDTTKLQQEDLFPNKDNISNALDFALDIGQDSTGNTNGTKDAQQKATDQTIQKTENKPADQTTTQDVPNQQSTQQQQAAPNQQQQSQQQLEQTSGAFTRLSNNLAAANTEINLYKEKINVYEQNNKQMETLGLDQTTLIQSAQFYNNFQNNPVEFVKNLLVNLKSSGYTIDESNPGLDISAINKQLDTKLAPIMERYNAEEAQSKNLQEAQTTLDTFYSGNPNARFQEDVIAGMLQKNPAWSLEKAYDEIRIWNADGKNNYDLSKPLTEQVRARKLQQISTNTTTQNNSSNVPIDINQMNGGNLSQPKTIMADDDVSFDDIISNAMRSNNLM